MQNANQTKGPVLTDFRKTRTIELPEYPGSQVEVYDNILVGDIMEFESLSKNQSPAEMLNVLPKFIKAWNFVDDEGNPRPVDSESMKILSIEAVATLAGELAEIVKKSTADKKKATQA